MDALERIRAALPLPEDEEARYHAERLLVRQLADELREVFAALPTDALRQELSIAVAICDGCGRQYGAMYDQRKWWTCNCYQERET